MIGVISDPERLVGFLGIVFIVACSIALFVRWLFTGPKAADPWDARIAEEVERADSPALCHRCLSPHDSNADFCPECGATVGAYTNLLPFVYLFSIGHTLRIGTSGEFKRTKLTVIGFVLVGLVEYVLFAPVYWFVFLRKMRRRPESDLPDNGSAGSPETSD